MSLVYVETRGKSLSKNKNLPYNDCVITTTRHHQLRRVVLLEELIDAMKRQEMKHKVDTITVVGKHGFHYEITTDPRRNTYMVWSGGENVRLFEFKKISEVMGFLQKGEHHYENNKKHKSKSYAE